MADWETRVVRSDGCRVAYDCRQGEGPEGVLLHGYGLDRTMWAPQLAALEGWTVLNLDIRGHGDSRPCADFSIPQAAEDLRAVLVKERCRAPVLVGLSMGGYVVQEYAWQFGGCAGYLVAGATPILLDCYSGWERAGLRASTPLLGVWPWRCLKSAMAMAFYRGGAGGGTPHVRPAHPAGVSPGLAGNRSMPPPRETLLLRRAPAGVPGRAGQDRHHRPDRKSVV